MKIESSRTLSFVFVRVDYMLLYGKEWIFMFTFNRKKKEDYDYIGKLIDQQGDILKIVADQREVIKELQETVRKLNKETQTEKKEA